MTQQRLKCLILAAWLLAWLMAACAHAQLVPNSQAAAKKNTETIANARGDVDAPGGIIYIEIPVRYSPNGGTIKGKGGAGVACSNAEAFNDDNPLYTVATRFVATNPAPDKDFLVLCGTGQKVRDVQFYGRAHETASLPPTGPKPRAAITIEGRDQPPSGRCSITDCLVAECEFGILTLSTPVETHADLGFVQNVYANNCRVFFGSQNIQSLSWTFVHNFIEEGDSPITGFEILRGGKIGVYGFYMNGKGGGSHITPLRVRDPMDPNGNCYTFHDLQIDLPSDGGYFCPIDTTVGNLTGCMFGHVNNPQFKVEYRKAGLNKQDAKKFVYQMAGAK